VLDLFWVLALMEVTSSESWVLELQRLNWRVWSWLRLNAGGMLYTCKSSGSAGATLAASGERVS